MSAEVRRALYKAEKYASLGGDELAAMMAFIGSATRLAKTIEGVRENGAPPPQLSTLRLIASGMVTHPEVADKIRACVDDQGAGPGGGRERGGERPASVLRHPRPPAHVSSHHRLLTATTRLSARPTRTSVCAYMCPRLSLIK